MICCSPSGKSSKTLNAVVVSCGGGYYVPVPDQRCGCFPCPGGLGSHPCYTVMSVN